MRRGASKKDCADAARFEGTTWVGRFLRLLELSPAIRHLIDWGQTGDAAIGFTAASEIARLTDRAETETLARATLQNKLTAAEVRQIVQLRLRSKKDIDESIAAGLKMRPDVEIRHVFIGAVTNETVQKRLVEMLQSVRNKTFNEILAKKFSALKATGRLGTDRFTLVGRDELGVRVKKGAELEAEINSELETHLDE